LEPPADKGGSYFFHSGKSSLDEGSQQTLNGQADAYLESLFEEDPDFVRVQEGIRNSNMPEVSVHKGCGRLLTLLVAACKAKRVLEIGALGGYSGICLMRGLPEGGRLTSLEIREDYAELARANWAAAGLAGKGEIIVGPAVETLARFEEEGRKFDFFFIDADKGNYPRYLEFAIRLGAPGALIVADNTLLHGKTFDPGREGPSIIAMREFNRQMAQDPRLITAHLSAFDGLALAVLR
jgi:predicted O-methyltransferase YrrM